MVAGTLIIGLACALAGWLNTSFGHFGPIDPFYAKWLLYFGMILILTALIGAIVISIDRS